MRNDACRREHQVAVDRLVCAAAVIFFAVVEPACAATHTVTIDGMAFAPATLQVARGDRVVWVNRDAFPHTVTAADKSFDSSSMDAGKQWVLVATKAGHFDYLCRFHPTMKGGLDVQ